MNSPFRSAPEGYWDRKKSPCRAIYDILVSANQIDAKSLPFESAGDYLLANLRTILSDAANAAQRKQFANQLARIIVDALSNGAAPLKIRNSSWRLIDIYAGISTMLLQSKATIADLAYLLYRYFVIDWK